MPLDSNGWAAASPEPSEYRDLLSFLREHPSVAFRPGELIGAVSGDFSTAIERERCKMLLETLVELGKVEKRRHHDTDLVYYRIDRKLVHGTAERRDEVEEEDADWGTSPTNSEIDSPRIHGKSDPQSSFSGEDGW